MRGHWNGDGSEKSFLKSWLPEFCPINKMDGNRTPTCKKMFVTVWLIIKTTLESV